MTPGEAAEERGRVNPGAQVVFLEDSCPEGERFEAAEVRPWWRCPRAAF